MSSRRRYILTSANEGYVGLLKQMGALAIYDASSSSGATAIDLSGNGHHAAVTGATVQSGVAPSGRDAWYFDGINDEIVLPSSLLSTFDTNEHTILVQSKSDEVSSSNRALWRYTSGSNFPFTCRNGTSYQVQVRTGGSGYSIVVSGVNTNWHVLTVSINVAQARAAAYFDDSKQTTTGSLSVSNATEFNIGSQGGVNYWLGHIATVAIFNYELSDAQVSQLHSEMS